MKIQKVIIVKCRHFDFRVTRLDFDLDLGECGDKLKRNVLNV